METSDPTPDQRLVQVQLCFDNDAGVPALAAVTRDWYVRGVAELGGELWQRLGQRPVSCADVEYRWDGEPGDVWAEWLVDFGMWRRVASLHERFPEALIWGATGGADGPHLVCWGAEPGEVWVWQCFAEDDPYTGMDIARDLRPVLAEVGQDPRSDGLRVLAGPAFAAFGAPETEVVVDPVSGDRVTVFDGPPGRQLYYTDEPEADEPEPDARDLATNPPL